MSDNYQQQMFNHPPNINPESIIRIEEDPQSLFDQKENTEEYQRNLSYPLNEFICSFCEEIFFTKSANQQVNCEHVLCSGCQRKFLNNGCPNCFQDLIRFEEFLKEERNKKKREMFSHLNRGKCESDSQSCSFTNFFLTITALTLTILLILALFR
jgi:hypothetical protein